MSSGNDQGADEFAEFEKAGDVEVGKPAIETNVEEFAVKPVKPAARRGPPKPAPVAKPVEAATPPKPGEGEEGAEGDDLDSEGDDEEIEDTAPKPKLKASERIQELNRRLRQSERLRVSDANRLDALETALKNGGLPNGKSGANSAADIGVAPDPLDAGKYPLGHLDDRYIEDKLDWLATKKAAEIADAALQRQQGTEQNRQAEQARTALLEKVDDLATRGSEQFDDFQESVVEAGMRGDWKLDQSTFEAAHEAENGAQILYELSQDKKEAARVASLTPFGQLKFVADRDAEIGKTKQPRKIPGAGAPPATQTRGANSRTRISPATDNLDDFEKAWEADAKGRR